MQTDRKPATSLEVLLNRLYWLNITFVTVLCNEKLLQKQKGDTGTFLETSTRGKGSVFSCFLNHYCLQSSPVLNSEGVENFENEKSDSILFHNLGCAFSNKGTKKHLKCSLSATDS